MTVVDSGSSERLTILLTVDGNLKRELSFLRPAECSERTRKNESSLESSHKVI